MTNATAKHTFSGPQNFMAAKAGDIVYSGAFCNFINAEPVRLVRMLSVKRGSVGIVSATWEVERAG